MQCIKSVFRGAITDRDGLIDSGYLGAFFVMAVVVGAVPFMCLLSAFTLYFSPTHSVDVQALGVGIGAVCAGFATAIGAVGLFRMGDRPRTGTTTTTTASAATTETETTTVAPSKKTKA